MVRRDPHGDVTVETVSVSGLPDTPLVAARSGLARTAMSANVVANRHRLPLTSTEAKSIAGQRPGCFRLHSAEPRRRSYSMWGTHMRGRDGVASHTLASRDHDISKGAVEDDRPIDATNAPGLDDQGLPNDQMAIAEDVLGAQADGSQG
jgi:hypothetical protein